jgi:Zn-dependent metalloprotease
MKYILLLAFLILYVFVYANNNNENSKFIDSYVVGDNGWIYFKSESNIDTLILFNELKSLLNITGQDSLSIQTVEHDDLNYTHISYNRFHIGLRVDQGEVSIHLDNKGKVYLVQNNCIAIEQNFSEPSLKGSDAIQIIKKSESGIINMDNQAGESNTELVIYNKSLNENSKDSVFTLAYIVMDKNNLLKYYVDAFSGEILFKYNFENNCQTGFVNTLFNGNQAIKSSYSVSNNYYLLDDCQSTVLHVMDWGNNSCNYPQPIFSTPEITSTNNTWTSDKQRFAGSLLWCTKETYNYFLNVHNRVSYNNVNGDVDIYALYNIGCNYAAKSSWFPGIDGTIKIVGGYNGNVNISYSTLDIIGHEFTHGIISSETSYQSTTNGEHGALMESFCDIFGEMVEYNTTQNIDYLIGGSQAILRSLNTPWDFNDPTTFQAGPWYTGSDNETLIYTNNAVHNYWFYLLVNGGYGTNDNGFPFKLNGIGINKARSIIYRNLDNYIDFNSDYGEARDGSLQSAIDLYGAASNEYNEVVKAWCAVGMGNNCIPSNCTDNFEPNNSCASAWSLFVNPFGLGTIDNTINANIGFAGDQDWYSFQISSCGSLTISLTNLPYNYNMELYTNCGGLALQGAYNLNRTDEQITFTNTSSGIITYHLKIYSNISSQATTADCYHLRFQWSSSICSCSSSNSLAGNTCPTATQLFPSTSCTLLPFTSCGATNSLINQCSGIQDDDVWFYFNATQSSYAITVQGLNDYDAAFQVFEQDQSTGLCGGSMPSIACQNNTGVGQNETANVSTILGKRYYIRVWHTGAGAGSTGNFQICVYNACNAPTQPTALIASFIQLTSFQANWNLVANSTSYYIDVATDASFTSMVNGFNNLNVGNVNAYSINGLSCNSSYYYRVRSTNGNCSSGNSNYILVATAICPSSSSPNFACQNGSMSINGTLVIAGVTISNTTNVASNNIQVLLKLFADPGLTQPVAVLGIQTLNSINGNSTASTIQTQYDLCSGIPNGTYYLGYYIDYFQLITEANESDNGWCLVSNNSIIVNCCVIPAEPTANGNLSCPGNNVSSGFNNSVTVSWLNNGPYNYDVEVYEYPFGPSNLVYTQQCISNFIWTVYYPFENGKIYAWRVRATTDCNNCNSNFTQLRYFHFRPVISPNTAMTTCDGSGVMITTPTFSVPSGANINYQWYKRISGVDAPIGNNTNTYYATSTGLYFVKLIYSGSVVCTGQTITDQSLFANITISSTPNPPILTTNSPVCSGSSLTLNASAVSNSAYNWSGPNGFTSNNPQIAFPASSTSNSGTYSCYIVNGGCPSLANSITVNVIDAPISNFTYSTVGTTVNFVNSSLNSTSYSWTFGDNVSSNQTNPSHVYLPNNSYNACLTSSTFGCSPSSFCSLITMGNGPQTPTLPTFVRMIDDTITDHTYWSPMDITQSNVDSGFVMFTYSSVQSTSGRILYYIKTDKNGNVQWVKQFPEYWDCFPYQVIKSSQGYLLAFYYANSAVLMEIDEQGNKIWAKQYGTNIVFNKVVRLNTGNYVIQTASNNGFGLFKVDNIGNILWQKTYTYSLFSNPSVSIFNILRDNSDNVYLVGYIVNNQLSFPNGVDGLFVKVDLDGNHIYSQYYNSATNIGDIFRSITMDTNQNIYISGYSYVSGGGIDGILSKFSSAGNIVSSIKILSKSVGSLNLVNNSICGIVDGMSLVEFNNNLTLLNQVSKRLPATRIFKKTLDNKFILVDSYLYNAANSDYRNLFAKISFSDLTCVDTVLAALTTSNLTMSLQTTTPTLSATNLGVQTFPVATSVSNVRNTPICQICQNEICNNGIDDDCNSLIDDGCIVNLNVSAFIEGYYLTNGHMQAVIDPINNPSQCDTFIVELHASLFPYNFIVSDTSILNTDGTSTCIFPIGVLNNSYYIVFRHRNGLQTWSGLPVLFNSNTISYSFTNSISKAYGNNLKNLGDGNFAIWSGDISHASLGIGFQDEVIESQDYLDMENSVNIIKIGYIPEDLTGDGIVEASDYIIMENNVASILFTIKP